MSAIAREAGKVLMDHFPAEHRIRVQGRRRPGNRCRSRVGASDCFALARTVAGSRYRRRRGKPPGRATAAIAGMSIRWTARRTSRMAIPSFVFPLGWKLAGVPQAGVLYDPTRDELFAAERGQGATLNGKPIRVSKSQNLSEAILGTGFPSLQATQEPEHTLLSPAYVAQPWRAARRLGGA